MADVKRMDGSFGVSASKDWPCALEPELRKAVSEHPDQLEANLRLGQFYVAHDEPASAIPTLKHAVEIDRGDCAASQELAAAWLESGEFENARNLLTALQERPAECEVHQLLARADEGLGRFQRAAEEYRIWVNQKPTEEGAFGIGYELLLAGSVTESVAAFEAAVRTYPRSIPLRIGLGTAQSLAGNTSAGLRSFLDATDIDPSDPRPYSFLARTASRSSDDDRRVRASFKRYLESSPDRADANYFYASELAREDAGADDDRIEHLLKRAIQLDPTFAKAYLLLGDVYAQRGDYASAAPEYEAAVRLGGDLDEAHYRLALAYEHTGHLDQSAREMEVFRLSKKRQSTGSAGVDLAQFISVMEKPQQLLTVDTRCHNVE
jgi:tetratricopeptide (TPR) repeat protein